MERAFKTSPVTYVAVNAFLMAIWALGDGGCYWPIWVILGWGIRLILHAWRTQGQEPTTEGAFQEEMKKTGGTPRFERAQWAATSSPGPAFVGPVPQPFGPVEPSVQHVPGSGSMIMGIQPRTASRHPALLSTELGLVWPGADGRAPHRYC